MKMQPSHRLFCPHPWPRPRLPFPQPTPTGRSLSRPRPEAAPARNPAGRLDAGMPRSRSSGTDPRVGLRSPERNGDALDGYNPRQGPKKYPECPDRGGGGGGEASKCKRKYPRLSPGSLPPSGHGAPGNLPSKRPPHTNTHKHTHTVRRSLAWRGFGGGWGGGIGLGDKGAGFPFRPEVVLRRNSSHLQETQRLPRGGFPASSRDRKVLKGGGRLPGKEVGSPQLKSKPNIRRGRFRNWM